MNRLLCLALSICAASTLSAVSISFPSGFVPFSKTEYVTAALPNGDRLVLGVSTPATAAGLNSIPLPTSSNAVFSDASVQLAPGQFFSKIYVPNAADRSGDYSEFAGLLIDPLSGSPFAGGLIPGSLLLGNGFYAFRLAPGAVTPSPEPSTLALLSMGVGFAMFSFRRRRTLFRIGN